VSTGAAFWLVAAVFTFMLFASSSPSPLYPVYQAAWGFSAGTLTVIFAVYAFALLLALLVAGSISDHVGRRPALFAALAAEALSMVLFATAAGIGGLVAARVLQGIATGVATGALAAALLDLQPAHRPGWASLANTVAPSAGLSLGAIGAGAAVQYGPAPRHLVFWLLAGVFALGLVGVALMPETVPYRPGWTATLRPRMAIPHPARAAFGVLAPSIVGAWALSGLYSSLGPSLMITLLHTHDRLVTALPLAALTGGGMVSAVLTRSWSTRRSLLVGTAVLVAGVAITLPGIVAGYVGLLLGGSVLAGLGFGPGFTGVVRLLSTLVGPLQRAELLAAVYVTAYLAFGLPAVAAGFATNAAGLRHTAEVYAVVVIVLAGGAGLEYARRTRDHSGPMRCYRIGRGRPGTRSTFAQEILATTGPVGVASPPVLGKLSRREPSEEVTHSRRPARNGLVGNSSGPLSRSLVVASGAFRKTSVTFPSSPRGETATSALRSFTATQMLPATSSAMPSAPSSSGCATSTSRRHSVSAGNVVSQPRGLSTAPSRLTRTFQIAPRAVSATYSVPPSAVNARPFATMCCEPAVSAAVRPFGVTVTLPGGSERGSRPTPPTPSTRLTSFTIGWVRNATVGVPSGVIRQTRPAPVPPSDTHRLPRRSKARPFAPATWSVNTVAVGGAAAFGVSTSILVPSPTNSRPCWSNARPAGPHGAARKPTVCAAPPPAGTLEIGQAAPAAARAATNRLPARSAVRPSIGSGLPNAVLNAVPAASGATSAAGWAAGPAAAGSSPAAGRTSTAPPTAAPAARLSAARVRRTWVVAEDAMTPSCPRFFEDETTQKL
jgi:MFS family permease